MSDGGFWDERYGSTTEYVYGTEPNDFLRENADQFPPGRILCLGEGEGRNSVFLAGLGREVTAVDISREGLRKAAALATEKRVTVDFVEADLATYEPAMNAFAGVVSSWLHLPPPLRTVVHNRALRALAPGGVFLLEAYTPAQLNHGTGGPKDVNLLYTVDLLLPDFVGFEVLIARELEREVNEGTFHGGKSAVIQLLARKN